MKLIETTGNALIKNLSKMEEINARELKKGNSWDVGVLKSMTINELNLGITNDESDEFDKISLEYYKSDKALEGITFFEYIKSL